MHSYLDGGLAVSADHHKTITILDMDNLSEASLISCWTDTGCGPH